MFYISGNPKHEMRQSPSCLLSKTQKAGLEGIHALQSRINLQRATTRFKVIVSCVSPKSAQYPQLFLPAGRCVHLTAAKVAPVFHPTKPCTGKMMKISQVKPVITRFFCYCRWYPTVSCHANGGLLAG